MTVDTADLRLYGFERAAEELDALRREAQNSRGLIARFSIRMDILREVLAGTYESGWPSNEYECDVYDSVVALRAENERLRAAAASIVDGLVYTSLHGGEMATLDLSKLNALRAALEGK